MQEILYKIFICILAGLGAGLGTGFAGMSAAVVISPMLTILLGIPAYEAVGIALASDVLASAISAYTYGKNKNIDIKNGIYMMIAVVSFTILGSYISSLVPQKAMGLISLIGTILMGLKFIFKPVQGTKELDPNDKKGKVEKIVKSVLCGAFIGFICGFVGAGGGIMMLFALTIILGYDLKKAVGTSVFIMTFSALTGALSHFALNGVTDWISLQVCILSTLIFSLIASKIANKADSEKLNRITGFLLLTLGLMLLFVKLANGIVIQTNDIYLLSYLK